MCYKNSKDNTDINKFQNITLIHHTNSQQRQDKIHEKTKTLVNIWLQ